MEKSGVKLDSISNGSFTFLLTVSWLHSTECVFKQISFFKLCEDITRASAERSLNFVYAFFVEELLFITTLVDQMMSQNFKTLTKTHYGCQFPKPPCHHNFNFWSSAQRIFMGRNKKWKPGKFFSPLLILVMPLEYVQTFSFWWSVGDWSGHYTQFPFVLRLHTGSLKHDLDIKWKPQWQLTYFHKNTFYNEVNKKH